MRTNKVGALVAVAALAVVLVACAPTFPSGSTLATEGVGPLVKITWPTLTTDSDKAVAQYRVDIDGVDRGIRVASSQRSCVVIGLPLSHATTITVSGYDSNNTWSGPSGAGVVTASYTTPASGVSGGTTYGCVSSTDTDGDRLPNAVESGNGVFLSGAKTGTSASVADSDGDGMKDGDEVAGTTAGLNLPAMGAKPTKKDLAFEFDWFDDNDDPGTCAAHSHRPTAGAIAKVATAYGTAPVSNPDGTTGIHLIADYGQGGAFTRGTVVADADGLLAGGVNGTDYNAVKAANFDANRQGIFHYVEMPHRYSLTSSSSGQAEINGNDMIVSLQCYGSDQNVANTIVHEAGHNLGLRHGGNVDTNYKPNYNSVMNYQYQFPGIDTNCTVPGDGVLSYSVGTRATLNEAALVEANGICGGVGVDWNANTVIDPGTIAPRDINQDAATNGVLTDFNDWANIKLGSVNIASPSPARPIELVTEQQVPAYAR